MIPIKITKEIEALYPDYIKVSIGPPADISEDDCGRIDSLVGQIREQSVFDGAQVFRVYWKPDEEEIKRLVSGLPIELSFFNDQMVVHSLGTL